VKTMAGAEAVQASVIDRRMASSSL
jgi:hypothetical protein